MPPLAPLLKKLRAVTAVAALGSSAEAARRLHVSPSAVVRAVQQVETVLEQRLFERSPRGLAETPAARALATRTGRALDLLAAAGPPMAGSPFATLLGLQPVPMGWTGSRLATNVGHRHLQALLGVAEDGAERQAATTLGISQSALHQTLAQLEHLAGGALFDRTRGGLRLNGRGETLWRAARWALDELRQAAEELATTPDGALRGSVTIGTLPFSTALFLPTAVERALAQHPDLQITVIDGVYETLAEALRDARIDLMVGALRPAPRWPELTQEVLFADQLAVVARAGHPLTRRRSPLSLAALQSHGWVLPMAGTPADKAFEQAFRAEGLAAPAAGPRVNSALMMEALVSSGDRLAMMSSRQITRQVDAGLLAVLPVALRHPARRIGLTTRRDWLPTPAAASLLEAIRDACGGLGERARR